MKIFQCDICKSSVSQENIRTLIDSLKSPEVEHICDNCNDKVAKATIKMERVLESAKLSFRREFILKLKARWRFYNNDGY